MLQAIRTFFGSPIGKIGSTALKLWHVAAAVTIVAAGAAGGAYAYTRYFAPTATPQHVVVFISGIDSSTKGCFNDTFSEPLLIPLEQQVGITNPYAEGCDNTGATFTNSPTSMVLYGYVGGHMDTAHGVWIPNDYDACNVNDLTLQSDIQGLDHLLDQYRQTYPSATFTLVGHSLGGLVALQGAYDYAVALHHVGVVNKVITLDAPLGGIQTKFWGDVASGIGTWLQQQACFGPGGSVVDSDIPALGDATVAAAQVGLATACANPEVEPQVVLSACAARALAQAGVGVVTLGNQQDGLYCNPKLAAARTTVCASQNLSTQAPVLGHLDNLTPLTDDTGFFAGHGTILNDPTANSEVIRDILAPVVTITQPAAGSHAGATQTGVAITYAATVRCLWGAAQHATAYVAAAGSQNGLFAGISSHASDGTMLNLNGVVILPPSLSAAAMHFYVDASGSACAYPAGAKFQPTANDFYGGAAAPVTFTVAQGGGASTAPTQPSNPNSSALTLAASPPITADAGDTFTAYFDELNTGNTTWSDAGGYQLICAASAPGNTCMGSQPTGLNGAQVAPGQQATVYVSLTAPDTAGTYKTAWTMGVNRTAFGTGSMPVTMKVNAAPTVYIGDNQGVLHAFDANTHHERWHFPTGGNSAQVLAVANGMVYVGEIEDVDANYVTSTVYAVNAATGAALWHIDGVSTILGVVYTGNVLTFDALDNGLLYLEIGNTITVVDAQTGHQKWQHDLDGPHSSFVEDHGVVVFSRDGGTSTTTLDAFDAATGNKLWTQTLTGSLSETLPTAADGTTYVGTCAQNGFACTFTLYAFESTTGNSLWQKSVGSGSFLSVQAVARRVYVATNGTDQSQFVKTFNAQTGAELPGPPEACQWADVFPTTDSAYETCSYTTPLVAAYDPVTGQQHWQQSSFDYGGETTIEVAAVSGGIVYVNDSMYGGAESGNLTFLKGYALDLSTGAIRWQKSATFESEGLGFAAIADYDGTVSLLDAHSGSVKWSFPAGRQPWLPFVFIAAS